MSLVVQAQLMDRCKLSKQHKNKNISVRINIEVFGCFGNIL